MFNMSVSIIHMKIYIYRYGSICEPDVIDSFKRLGLEVHEECMEMFNKNLTPSECVAHTSKDILDGGYSFVFSINFFPWLSDVCNIARIVYISLIVDSPVLELYSKSLSNPCNRVFLFDKLLYKEFAPYNPGHVFHVPLATNVTRTDKVINEATASERKHFQSDISFIGSTYQEKCDFNKIKLNEYDTGYVNGLIEAQLKIYGYNFIEDVISDEFADRFLKENLGTYVFPEGSRCNNRALVAQHYISVKVAEQERLRILKMLSDFFNVDIYTGSDTSSMPHIHNRGFAKSLEEMPIIFNNSKINLNITLRSIKSGIPLRCMDIMGAGGFLLTNYQADFLEYFTPDKDFVYYESIDDLIRKCDYYIKHEDERKAIALNGYNKVKEFHNYKVRLNDIFKIAGLI